MNIDIRDVTILFLCVVVVCLLRSCAADGNRADVLPVPAEDAENTNRFRQEALKKAS